MNIDDKKDIEIDGDIKYSPIKSLKNEVNEPDTKKKIQDLKSQLDHNIYDMITKCNIEESQLIRKINNIVDSQEKQRKEEELIELKESNERKISIQKE